MRDVEGSIVLEEIHHLLSPHAEIVGRMELHPERIVTKIGHRHITITSTVVRDESAHPSVAHAHVVVETDQNDLSGHLDACVVGIDPDRRKGLQMAADSWYTGAAGPIFSLFHARPVLDATHFDGAEHSGVYGAHGFAGPLIVRMASEKFAAEKLLVQPMFQYAAEMAPSGLVHLAKTTLNVKAGEWVRTIEVDGHMAAYVDSPWNAGVTPPRQVVASRFATFHYADQPQVVEARRQLDETIREYVQIFDNLKDTDQTSAALLAGGKSPALVDRIDHFLRIGFGRRLITSNLPFQAATTYHRVQPSGELVMDLPLMSEPVFARSLQLAMEFVDGPLSEATKQLALLSGEVDMINQALNAGSKLEHCRASPFLVPDMGTSQETFSQAFQKIEIPRPKPRTIEKPWWQFWN